MFNAIVVFLRQGKILEFLLDKEISYKNWIKPVVINKPLGTIHKPRLIF